MATTINAGRVRFVSRGTYNNSTQYYLFDLVDYNGSSYIAKENSLGNLPTNTQYWQLIAEKGNTGSTGQTGPVGPTGNGIASITKTGTDGLVDTYTITYTNGNTTTFTITNGEDGEVTETELNVLRQKVANQQKVIDQLPQVTGQGTSITLENTIEAQFTKFEIEGNSTQDGTPSPDNEVPILSAGDNGSINEKISNKNLLPNEIEDQTINGITVKKDDDGGYIFNGTASKGTFFYMFSNQNLRIPAGTYIQSVHKSGTVSGNSYFEMRDINGDTISGGALNIYNTESKSITLTEDVYVKQSTIYFGQGRVLNNFKIYPMLEPGSTATDYVPHEEQDYSIPVQQPMRSIGDVRDKFVKIDGNWFERHYISRYIFTGEEPVTISGTRFQITYYKIPSALDAPALCNISQYGRWVSTGKKFNIANKDCYFTMDNFSFTTTQEFQDYLAERYANGKPVYADYLRKTPLDLPCTPEQIQQLENIPSTYKDFTIIQSQDETEAYLEVSGIYDLNNLINN